MLREIKRKDNKKSKNLSSKKVKIAQGRKKENMKRKYFDGPSLIRYTNNINKINH